MTRNSKAYVLGIDPGAKGGMACLRVEEDGPPTLLFVADLPYAGGRFDVRAFHEIVNNWGVMSAVYLEKAQVMPSRNPDGTERASGAMGRFNYGVSYGLTLGACLSLHCPVEEINAAAWKKATGLTKDKGASRAMAQQAFPLLADHFSRVRDDGRAEAALIARYGARQWTKRAAA